MGLEMYLTKRTYVKNWDLMRPEESHQVMVTKNGERLAHIQPERITYIIEEIGYWWRAMAIHNWFVGNVQNGIDDGQQSYVSREKLAELLNLVNEVLADQSKAQKLLPLRSEFFSVPSWYEEYYLGDLELTKEILERALEDSMGDFYYQASW
jgi:hypothetical protein